MGNKRTYYNSNQRKLTVAMQGAVLKLLFPDSTVKLNKNISLTWTGNIQPSPLSDVYTVKIRYKLSNRPRVTVVTPELIARNGVRIPHLFPEKELCLFRYKYYEWNSRMSIAETIVPWASLWLMHYEIWLATGVWCGSKQEHPGGDKPKEPEQSAKDN